MPYTFYFFIFSDIMQKKNDMKSIQDDNDPDPVQENVYEIIQDLVQENDVDLLAEINVIDLVLLCTDRIKSRLIDAIAVHILLMKNVELKKVLENDQQVLPAIGIMKEENKLR